LGEPLQALISQSLHLATDTAFGSRRLIFLNFVLASRFVAQKMQDNVHL
jgi:hypothetical protein